jgi:hypothetical protein
MTSGGAGSQRRRRLQNACAMFSVSAGRSQSESSARNQEIRRNSSRRSRSPATLNPGLEKKAARGAALFLLFIQLQAVIEMSLLRELGFACRAVEAILERVGRYAQIEHLKAIVAGDEAEYT